MKITSAPVILSIAWILSLCTVNIPAFEYNEISTFGYFYYIFMIVLFIISYIVLSLGLNKDVRNSEVIEFSNSHLYITKFIFYILLILTPFYLYTLVNQVGFFLSDPAFFFVIVRHMSLNGQINIPFYLSNVPVMFLIITYLFAINLQCNKAGIVYYLIALILSLCLALSTGGRFSAVASLMTHVIIFLQIDSRNIVRKSALFLFLAVFVMVGAGLLFGRGNGESALSGLKSFVDYFVNGVILFDNVILINLNEVHFSNTLTRFFTDTLTSLQLIEPIQQSKISKFYDFGGEEYGNVFTMFGQMVDSVGLFLSPIIIVFYGFIYAVSDRFKFSTLALFCVNSYIVSGLVFSIVRDPVLTDLNFIIKIVIIITAIDFLARIKLLRNKGSV